MADAQKHITYSYADIERYLQGKMNATEMHEMEKAALTDAFLADAIEGYAAIQSAEANKRLHQIEAAILGNQEKAKVVAMPVIAKKNYWRIAASVIALIGIGGITFLLLNRKPEEQTLTKTAINQPKENIVDKNNSSVLKPNSTVVAANKKPAAINNGKVIDKKLKQNEATVSSLTLSSSNKVDDKVVAKNDAIIQHDTLTDVTVISYGSIKKKEVTPPVAVMENKVAVDSANSKNVYLAGRVAGVQTSIANNASLNYTINGRVINQAGMPVANASVNVLNKRVSTTTNSNGEFSLSLKDSTAKVSVNSIGMEQAVAVIASDKENSINLTPAQQSLSEVVISSMVSAKKKAADAKAFNTTKIDTLMPEGGWDNFKVYVNNKLSTDFSEEDLKGDIELELKLDKTGKVEDVDIVKSPNEKINNAVVKAVKEGPKWIDNTSYKKKKEKRKVSIQLK
ncbi:MAG: hypothetical protein C0459_11740 [Chitinophaga sp.]|jgi:CarboxypepD_reg-like domain|nr:hypothetical protein [Chitinophaga sp.]